MVRTSTSALRVRIYLLLMNCKLALRRNLHYAGFRQYSTHVYCSYQNSENVFIILKLPNVKQGHKILIIDFATDVL